MGFSIPVAIWKIGFVPIGVFEAVTASTALMTKSAGTMSKIVSGLPGKLGSAPRP
tara:strand:+ start:372 stop:536 length:165 start_codon:yes stop_codon:yes gene_type:complete